MKHGRLAAAGCGLLLLFSAVPAFAHCDALDGPVVKDARRALEAREVAPVLKWIAPDAEAELREAFAQVLAVRGLTGAAQPLADRYFFETLVRLHRQGEGAPYTGLKPAGTPVDPAVMAADRALETGSAEALARLVAVEVEHGLQERFARVQAARRQAERSPELGRVYVAAYVEFVHYAERLRRDATTTAGHHAGAAEEPEH